MKRIVLSLTLMLSVFTAGVIHAASAGNIIPASSKVLVVVNNLEWINKLVTTVEDNDENQKDMQEALSLFDGKSPAYMSVFGEIPSIKKMSDGIESNMIIIAKLKGSTKDLYNKFLELQNKEQSSITDSNGEAVKKEKITLKKYKNGVVGIDDIYILPLKDKMVAFAPMPEVLYRYKKVSMLNSGSGEDVDTLKAFIKEYKTKDLSSIIVPSVMKQILAETPIPFPPTLSKYNLLEDLKDLVIYVEKNAFVVSIRMKSSSTALKNIFSSKNKGISVKGYSPKDPTAYVELAFAPEFLKDIITMLSEKKGSSMPPETLDSVFSALTGNFGVNIWPAEGKTDKEIMDDVPRLLAFIGTTSDNSAQQLLGMMSAMAPLSNVTVAGTEAYLMNVKGDTSVYITVNKSHIVIALDKKTLASYLKNSGSSKKTFKSDLVNKVFDSEVQGVSIFVRAKELMDALSDKVRMEDMAKKVTFEQILLYLGPSGNHDAFNIKIFYK